MKPAKLQDFKLLPNLECVFQVLDKSQAQQGNEIFPHESFQRNFRKSY